MGNEQIKPSIAHSSEWTFIREIKSHPLFGHIKVYKGPSDQLQCLKTVIVEESQYKDQMDSLKKIIVKDVLSQNQPNCSSLVCVNRLETQKQEEFCSNYVKIYLTADYSDQPVQELKDVKLFMLDIIQALSVMDQKGVNNCQFCPAKILQFGDRVKVVNTQLFTETSDYEQLYFNEVSKDDWMIAPEVMHSLKVNCPPSFNSELAVIFNFGIMMIYLLTGVHPKDADIYDYKNLTLNDNLSSYVQSIEQLQIPSHIKQLIQDCVNVKPNQRPTFKLITNLLRQVEIPLQVSHIKNEEVLTSQIFNPCYEDVKKVLSESHVNKNLNFHNESPQKIEKQQFMTDTQQSAQFRKSKQIYNLENTYNSRSSIQQKQQIQSASTKVKIQTKAQKVKSPSQKPKPIRANGKHTK
ncbi:unnamed protein product (macronuclear) [Paramecium tetraurelia]|uniref:Protein kinase domain-containing protein n=1 Tax=Paramecium tetraurelia TaxID=5888 RepID=A0DN23_PARTE|nr:uncharacterized protein GSPATT00018645001 [Paramecium tetraurelia]CAK84440.1 unnamed protein product [Paramecium tetraurelia]|eukprot:XP_001451837.1 hypothetical protein (macronuclear) [Paramecium tetraurelia strain d4-2]